MIEMDLLKVLDESTDLVLMCGLFGDGELDMTFCSNASLALPDLLFLLPHCL